MFKRKALEKLKYWKENKGTDMGRYRAKKLSAILPQVP